MVTGIRNAILTNDARRKALVEKLHRRSLVRINRIRKTVGYASLPNEEVRVSLETAVALGLNRALLNRFSKEKGLDADWWRDKRRAHAKTAKDRTQDFHIISLYYPEFKDYSPAEEPTDNEIVDAAESELYDLLAAPGTDYHQTAMQIYKTERFDGDLRISAIPYVNEHRVDWVAWSDELRVEVVDDKAQERVEQSLIYSMLNDGRNIFGPGLTRVATLAIRHFGRGGLFWLAEWLFFPGRYTELLRVIGLDEETLGKTKFEAIKRDMVRKLPQTHADMMEILRNDPVILRLRDMLYGEDFFDRLPPRVETQEETETKQVVEKERALYIKRQHKRMLDYVRSQEDIATYADKLAEQDGMTPLLQRFIAADGNPARLAVFKREVKKEFGGTRRAA